MSQSTAAERAQHVEQLAREQHPHVVAWRRQMHHNPELSFQEVQTAEFLANALQAIDGLTLERPTATSLVAVLRGGKPGATLAIRADIDALPIQDAKTCDYASGNPGAMHACGHDGHAAMLLGAAHILAGMRDQVPGEVRFFFQHAEELHPGGAQEMVDAGVMEGVDRVISAHVMSLLDVGHVSVIDGPTLASSDRFTLTVTGRGGHASMPNMSVDPLWVAAQIVTNLQAVVSRNTNPLDPVVVSVTRFHAGEAFNVIPDQAEIGGSVRCFSEEVRNQVPELIERIANGVAQAHGATVELNYVRGYSSVVNDPVIAGAMRDVVTDCIASAESTPMPPLSGSEDFSAFLKKAPGAYAFIGARNEARGIVHPHHHPHFDFDEEALLHGVQLFVNAPFAINTLG